MSEHWVRDEGCTCSDRIRFSDRAKVTVRDRVRVRAPNHQRLLFTAEKSRRLLIALKAEGSL